MRILVTGGNGYVGRELCRRLCHKHEVAVADNLRNGPWRFDGATASRLDLREIDIRNPREATEVLDVTHPDVVIHLAAIHFIPECEKYPTLAVATNVGGTVNLLNATPPGSRFVFASSGAVYEPGEEAHREDTSPTGPTDTYGLTKLHGEQYLRYLAAQRDLQAVIVRLFNVIGPGETNPHILPEIIAQLKMGRSVLRLGNISSRRDFIHVSDAADGFAAAAVSGEIAAGIVETVNLAGGRRYSVSEMIETLGTITGRQIQVEHDGARMRKVDRPSLLADVSRMQTIFGWKPRRSFAEAVADTWRDPELAPWLINGESAGTAR